MSWVLQVFGTCEVLLEAMGNVLGSSSVQYMQSTVRGNG